MRRVSLLAVGLTLVILAGGCGVAGHRSVAAKSVPPARVKLRLPWAQGPDQLRAAPIRLASLRRGLEHFEAQLNRAGLNLQGPRIKRAIHAPSVPAQGATSCAVGTVACSLRPCVEFAGSATPAVLSSATPSVASPPGVVPLVPGGPRAEPCHRAGGPGQTEAIGLARAAVPVAR